MAYEKIQWLIFPVCLTVGSLIGLLIFRALLFKSLSKLVENTKSQLDDIIVRLVKTPSLYWCFAVALYIGINFSNVPNRYEKQMNEIIHVILILSLTIVGSNVATAFFRNLLKSNHPNSETSALSIGIVKGACFAVGFAIILSVLGISIAPVLTALGVGGLAVALALKDTLENLFSGIYLLTDKTIRVGDFVRLDSGQEGYVSDIGWRTARFTTGNNSTVIIPNSKLASTILTNHSFPDKRLSTHIVLQVDGKGNLDQMEAALLNVLKKGSEDVAGMQASPDPSVRLVQINSDGSLTYHLNFTVKEIRDQAYVSHVIRKRVYQELGKLGVCFPKSTVKLVPT